MDALFWVFWLQRTILSIDAPWGNYISPPRWYWWRTTFCLWTRSPHFWLSFLPLNSGTLNRDPGLEVRSPWRWSHWHSGIRDRREQYDHEIHLEISTCIQDCLPKIINTKIPYWMRWIESYWRTEVPTREAITLLFHGTIGVEWGMLQLYSFQSSSSRGWTSAWT